MRKRNKIKKIVLIFAVLLIGIVLSLYFFLSKPKEVIIEEPDSSFHELLIPTRNSSVEEIDIQARAGLVSFIDSSGVVRNLFEKEELKKVPIASITKLMTALVILEEMDLDQEVVITEQAFLKDFSRINTFYVGEKYKVRDLLYPLLMESSNAVAYALVQPSEKNFVDLMNKKAIELGMNDTFFVNASGLDPETVEETANYSTAQDIVVFVKYLLDKPLIWEILSLPEYQLRRSDGYLKHAIINTNSLLQEIPGTLGGKTGTTNRALQCFVLVVEKNPEEYLVSVVLGSRDRFNEAREMINWVNEAYYWEI